MHLVYGGVENFSMGNGYSGSYPINVYPLTSWPNKWYAPIVLNCAVWGGELAKQSVCVQSDNFSIVVAIIRGLPEITVMHLLR